MSEGPEARTPPPKDWGNPVYGWYVVFVLTLAYTCSFIDRQILTLLIEPIRRDLHVSDTQVSLLGGLAFTRWHYAALMLPCAIAALLWLRVARLSPEQLPLVEPPENPRATINMPIQ